jgi:hypothetical protein
MRNLPNVVKVEGTPFVRELGSMGLSNMDATAKNEYFAKVKMLSSQKKEINSIKTEISSIQNDVNDIKNLLKQLIGKGGNG